MVNVEVGPDGVPEITPVELFKLRPVGNDPTETVHDDALQPVMVRVVV